MTTKKFFLPLFLAALVLSVSCSKEDEPEIRDFETLGFDTEVVLDKLPEGLVNSNDEYAQMAVDYVESALDWGVFSDQLTPPDDAMKTGKKSSETYTWSWNYGGGYVLTMWWEYRDDASKNYWDIDIQYADYPRSSYLQAWETKDGRSGEVKYNWQWACVIDESTSGCEDYYWMYSWNLDNDDNYTFDFLVEAEEDGVNSTMNYQVLVNNDGSGSVDYYFYDELFYSLDWDAAGNGSWVYYFGDESMSGTWTVD